MAKYLRAVYTTNRGNKRTISILNPKSGLTLSATQSVLSTMTTANMFTDYSGTVPEYPDTLVDLYYEETVITSLTDI